jgi:hypothetical protein
VRAARISAQMQSSQQPLIEHMMNEREGIYILAKKGGVSWQFHKNTYLHCKS